MAANIFAACSIIVLAISSAFSGALAQVMGLKMGESLSSIKSKGVSLTPDSREYLYNATNLPQSARVVPDVLLVIHPRFGLCTISAASPLHDDNAFGSETRYVYDEVKSLLVSKYSGPTKSYDFTSANSAWAAEHYFMTALNKKERFLSAFWRTSDGARLPQGIKLIQLTAWAVSSSQGYVSVKYESDFHAQCVGALKSSEALGL